MSDAGEISALDAATLAFEIRFESELAARWEKLETATAAAILGTEPGAKLPLLSQLFEEAGDRIAGVIHEYFPKMLSVATAQGDHIGQPPIDWTKSLVLVQVCNFLGMDPRREAVAAVMDDSLVKKTARRVVAADWDEEGDGNSEFTLPWWADGSRALNHLFAPRVPFTPQSGADTETMSPDDSLKWVMRTESSLWKRLNQQLEDEGWDGIIDAGRSGVSVFAEGTVASRELGESENVFMRSGTGWRVRYNGVETSFSHREGFSIIHLALGKPGEDIPSAQVLSLCGKGATVTGKDARPKAASIEHRTDGEEGEEPSITQSSPNAQAIGAREDIRRLWKKLTDYDEAIEGADRNSPDIPTLKRERAALFLEISKFTRPGGALRTFQDKSAKQVRDNVSRAIADILPHIGPLALHLRHQLKAGSRVCYLDISTSWRLK